MRPTTRMLSTAVLLAGGLVIGCGDDSGGGTPPPQPGGAQAGAPPATAGSGKLVPQVHVEDRVACPAPGKDAKPCQPNDSACDPTKHQYCIATQDEKGQIAYFCGVCAERDTIREALTERDFTLEDPFMLRSRVEPGSNTGKPVGILTESCNDKQLVASNYSYADLKLVGIVAQGTKRKVLMMDGGGLGNIIQLKDCVGREKALVKDIGDGYVTFQVDVSGNGSKFEDRELRLHPKQLAINSTPFGGDNGATPGTTAPVVTPQSLQQGRPETIRGGTVIVPAPPPQAPKIVPIPPPAQAPTTMRP